ncbi:hypothetical protein WR25_04462 [Diploscapter pachys]|uniref:Uncharacterized protein n=1 Tax=Diploscapter pachys TaxID=2018661 RepID=A0A2A2M342_9BILA|nr:hypothetical protein WR25_04462 [Diploscapter pachys]
MRLGIDRVADRGELGQHRARVLAAQQRPGVAPADALGEHVRDQSPRLGIDEGAAAGRDHLWRAVDQPGDDAAFAVTEIGLAEAFEDLGDGHARRLLDRVVGVDEGQPQAGGKAAPHGRLADPHQPDEHDRAWRFRGGMIVGRGNSALQHRSRRYTAGQDGATAPVCVYVLQGTVCPASSFPSSSFSW